MANELGASNGKGAKFAAIVSSATSLIIGLVFCCLIVIFHDKFGLVFSSSNIVLREVNKLSILLAFTILFNSVQPILSGMPHFLSILCISKAFFLKLLNNLLPISRSGGWIRLAILCSLYKLGLLLFHWFASWHFDTLVYQPWC